MPFRSQEFCGYSENSTFGVVSEFRGGCTQLRVAQVADARRESKFEHAYQAENMVGEAGDVGVVLLDPQVGRAVHQPSSTYVKSRTPTLTTLALKGAYLSRERFHQSAASAG
jgi:hypothetical protein